MNKFFKLMAKLALKFLVGFAVLILVIIIAIVAMNIWDKFDLLSKPAITRNIGVIAVVFIVVLSVALLIWQDASKNIPRKELKKKMKTRPPITEDEFLTHFDPQDHDLALRLRRIISNCCKIPVKKIYPKDNLSTFNLTDSGPWILMQLNLRISPQSVARQISNNNFKNEIISANTIQDLIDEVNNCTMD